MRAKTKMVIPGGRPDRIVRLTGMIDGESAQHTNEALLAYGNDGNDPIVLHISSPGGCVASGLSVIDIMSHVHAPVFAVAIATVASMAAIILACAEPGYRYALPHTRIMLHQSSGHVAGRFEKIRSGTSLHRQVDLEVEALLLSATHLSKTRLRHLLRQERFLSASEAQALGIIDHILK